MIDDLPSDAAERAVALQEMLVSFATDGKSESNQAYQTVRREFMDRTDTHDLLPSFVRTCRTLAAFWSWIKNQSAHWEPRRVLIREAFVPLLDYLEGRNTNPVDHSTNDALTRFDAEGVHALWEKALRRRKEDPEGAITAARTLLEAVCKRILDDQQQAYGSSDDLPKLYGLATKGLNLAPSQHTEEAFKAILGGCHTVINGLSTLRNRIGDAHGQGSRPVKPASRHAALAVNLAGAMATFLVETLEQRKQFGAAQSSDGT